MLNKECFFFIITNLITAILYVLIGGVIPLIERKVLSLTHRRVGPKYIGYKGRLQFIADAVKLLIKEFFLPKNTNKFLFFITPVFLLNLNLFLLFNTVWFCNISGNQLAYSILFIQVLESLNSVFFFL